MTASATTTEPYILLRAAVALFKKTPADLEPEQLQQVTTQARNEMHLETKVLESQEAASVVIPDAEQQAAYKEIRARYEDEDSFIAALEKNGLDIDSLQQALHRQCKVNAVFELVASKAQKPTDEEVSDFYQQNSTKFTRPEHREASHILISINDKYFENSREQALKRIQKVEQTLRQQPEKFKDLALKHSECPTAMQGGVLGKVPRGKLYPELDKALFKMQAGEISVVLESEMGFHILRCEQILPEETVSLEAAREKIYSLLLDRYKQNAQRQWLAGL